MSLTNIESSSVCYMGPESIGVGMPSKRPEPQQKVQALKLRAKDNIINWTRVNKKSEGLNEKAPFLNVSIFELSTLNLSCVKRHERPRVCLLDTFMHTLVLTFTAHDSSGGCLASSTN